MNERLPPIDRQNYFLVEKDYPHKTDILENLISIEGETSYRNEIEFEVAAASPVAVQTDETQTANGVMHDLYETLANRSFKGIVVFALTKEHSGDLARILYDRSFKIRYEIANFFYDGKFHNWPLRLEQLLALAELVCVSGGEAVIVADAFTDSDFIFPDANGRLTPRFPLRFKVAQKKEIKADYFGSLAFRRRSGFQPGQVRSFFQQPKHEPPWESWRLHPEIESREWVVAEFPQFHVRERFQKMVCEVFGEVALPNDDRHVRRYFMHYHRVALSAIRLARAMAIRTLEGAPFCGTIFLPGDFQAEPDDNNPVIVGLPSNDQERLFFNFDHRDLIGNVLELAQSPSMRVWVDPTNGHVKYITHALAPANPKGLRFWDVTDHYPHNGLWIQILGNGRLEVYSRPEDKEVGIKQKDGVVVPRFSLRYDGFEWERDPSTDLRERLENFFKKETSDWVEFRRKIGPAILQMLDKNESSIVVLVGDEDRQKYFTRPSDSSLRIEELHLTRMRKGVILGDRGSLNIKSLSHETLAGMLHTDGAHFIAANGDVLHLNMRVSNTAELDQKPADEHVGSGANTGADLQKALVRSLVIKVSASGGVKFF